MKILLIIDAQNDFCPGGNLAVPNGDEVVPVLNSLIRGGGFDHIIASQDWHPENHTSFAVNHSGRSPFEMIQLNVDTESGAIFIDQMLWPAHCVQGTPGAEFHSDLLSRSVDYVVQKGTDSEIDSYSAFFDNAKLKSTGLGDYLDALAKEIGLSRSEITLVVAGLATDYCVKFSAIDAARLGFAVEVPIDACRGITTEGEKEAIREMNAAGVSVITSREILQREVSLPVTRGIEVGMSF